MTEEKDRFASFRAGGSDRFGVVTDDGVIDLTTQFGGRYGDLQAAVEAGALDELAAAARGRSADFANGAFEWLIPLARPR